jgi:hypothetical protein
LFHQRGGFSIIILLIFIEFKLFVYKKVEKQLPEQEAIFVPQIIEALRVLLRSVKL